MSMSVLEVYNAAISAARGKGRLSSLSQNSREREECDLWYPLVRRQVQEAAFWPGSRKVSRLTLLSDEVSDLWVAGEPEIGYYFSYGLPADCLRPWHLSDYSLFSLSFDATRSRIVLSTNTEDATLIYASDQENPTFWAPGQRMATVAALAASICGVITGQNGLEQMLYKKANDILMEAQASAANAENILRDTIPPNLAVRENTLTGSSERYYYPFGPIFNA